MSLRVYNSLSRTLEDFQPLVPGQVRMYVCGITVYDMCHMGHLRMNMAFDVINRWLRARGYDSANPWNDFANSGQAPDGSIYLLTEEVDGAVLKLEPAD